MRLTLRAQLALWAALATGLAVTLVAAGLYWSVNGFLRQAQEQRLLSVVEAVQGRVEGLLRPRPDENLLGTLLGVTTIAQTDLERIADDVDRRTVDLRVVAPQSGGLASVGTPNFPGGVPLNLRPGPGAYLTATGAHLILVRSLRAGTLLQVAVDARALREARQAFTRALTWLLPLALLLSLLVGWVVAGRLLRPVRALESAARAVGEGGDLRRPLPGAGHGDELARLALTLQRSYAHLADARDREQGFLRAAAHDLRSPLAALTARVEGTLARERDAARYRADLQEIGTDITRLATLANHLLLLARDPAAVQRAPVPLRDLAADAVDRARELDPLADVDLDAPQAVTVPGDRVLLGQAIWNLTTNAVRHAPGATVTVQVRAVSGGAAVTVQDDGPGVDEATLARLGEAFYRPDASRTADASGLSGHGLGLALARHVAQLHGGTLALQSAPGAGFRAALHLPGEGGAARAGATLGGNEQAGRDALERRGAGRR
ncbi:HAMP domain-containing histidine kinase [Deinococcus taeanensis]|uniref:sensor histidine kinase n=1 Tax=Deinococcus taeanensis TaxID=2737050 RepID=UPI001CDB6613|nr:HAMP domain-containing sensor histidine kinase [Deinococcus taeanensis]UBV42278.1 HAMP domain-containing histidine kinase [Deinococcus taeanensis]